MTRHPTQPSKHEERPNQPQNLAAGLPKLLKFTESVSLRINNAQIRFFLRQAPSGA